MFNFTIVTPSSGDISCRAALLSFDNEIKILADPSWNGKNPDDILFMESHLKEVNLIILSHSTPEFIGGFILLCVKFPSLMSNIPIYSTLPINQLGRISTVEYYRSCGILGPLESAIMEVVDVDEWFDKVQPLKYNQALTLFDGRIVMTPHNAGHTLGGTFWLITKRLEKIIYAPSWNHSKDSFLNSASFLSTSTGNPLSSLIRPTVLITNTDLGSSMSHKKRTEKFLQLVDATLANGGAVLLPTTLSGRFLELLHLVDEHLQGAPIPVYFLSYSGTRVLSYASNFLEWMSSQLFKSYEDFAAGDATGQSKLPFNPAKVDLLLDPDELIQLAGPKIVFASGIDLKNGDMSSQALQYLCQDEKTTIILTEKTHFGSEGSINAQLFKSWYNLAKKKQGGQAPEDGVAVPFEETISLDSWTREEKLIGGELAEFQQRINNQRQQKLLAKVREKQNENLLNTDSLNAEDSSEDEDEGNTTEEERTDEQSADPSKATPSINNGLDSKAIAVNQLSAHETFITDYVKESLEAYRPLDIKITYKLRPRQAMFPYISNNYKQNFDDYGEVIDVKSFQKADESSNKKLIMESKKKFEKKWGNDKDGNKKDSKNKNNNQNKLTPQEQLNNELLQNNLDTLFNPRKRVPLTAASTFSNQAVELKARCGLSFVDLSGIVDIRSLGLIVSALKPYNLLLLPDLSIKNDSSEELDGLRTVRQVFEQQQEDQQLENSKKSMFTSSRFLSSSAIRSGVSGGLNNSSKMNIISVSNNNPVEIGGDGSGVGINDFEVKLDEKLIESLKWQKIADSYSIAQVYGKLDVRNPHFNPHKKQKTVADYINPSSEFILRHLLKEEYLQKQQKLVQDKKLATAAQLMNRSGPKLAIGNIRLPELKKKLLSKNYNAEFKSEGTLVVNDTLAIRKVAYTSSETDDTGDIVIDGMMGPLYYEVKECISEMLAYV